MKYEELKSRFDALDGEVQKYIRDYPEEKDIADLWGQVHSSFGNYTSRKFPELQVTTGAAPREQQPIEPMREHPDTPTGAGGGYGAPPTAIKSNKPAINADTSSINPVGDDWPITPEKDSIGTPLNKTFNMIAQLPGQAIKMAPSVIALLARQGLTGQPGNTMPSTPRERSSSAYNAVKPTTDKISGNYSRWIDEHVPYDKPTGKYAKPAKTLLPKDFNAPIFINTPSGPIDVSPAVKALATENLTDPRRAYKTIVENSGTMTVFAAASFANPAFGFALMASAEGAETARAIDEYQQMTGKQVDPDLRAVLEISTATVNGLLEKVGLDAIIKTGKVPGLSEKISQAIVAHLTEGSQEGLQEVTQILAESGYNNEARKWSEQIPRISESFYGGLIASLPATTIAGVGGYLSEKKNPKYQPGTGEGAIPPESGATVQPEPEPAAQPDPEQGGGGIPPAETPATVQPRLERTSKSAIPKSERKQAQAGARLLDEFQQEDVATTKTLQQRIAAALAQAKQKREAEQPKPVPAITVEPKPAPQPKPLPTKITGDVKLDARIRKAVGPNEEAKTVKLDTSSGKMFKSGEVATTATGRKTTPFPTIKTGQRLNKTLNAIDGWMHSNAIEEAKSRGDDWNVQQFGFMNPKLLSTAEKDMLDDYLFSEQPQPAPEPAEQPAKPEQGEPKEPEKMTQEDYDYYVMKPFRDEVESINEQLKKLDRTPRSKNVNIRIKRIHQESDLKDRLAELEKNRPISQYKVMMSALQENKTVNAVALDKWGITKYEGYVREGDLYVYNPEKAKQQTEQPIEEKKEPENEPIRTINIPGRGIIEVKGTGAATYWRDPSAGMRSPFGSNFVLASPEFRDEIEKASGDELQQAIDTYNAANEKYRKSHYDEKARENYRNAKNDLQEKVNNEIIKRLPDDAGFDAGTIQNFYDKLGREEVDRIIERTVEEATANYEAEKEKTERTIKAFADRKDEYLKAGTVKERKTIIDAIKDISDNTKNIGYFGAFPVQKFNNKFDTKQKPADVLFKNNIVSDDAGRPALTGVFHSESGDLVATDGHAMVVIHNKSDKSGKIRLDDGLEAAGDLMYPNYEVVMPKKPETLGVVDVEEMLNIGKSADKLRTKDDYPMVRIGEQRYNSNYVKRIASVLYELGIKKVNVLQGEKGHFGPGPILFKDAKGKVTALLMPVRGDKANYTVTITGAPKQSTSSPGYEAERGGYADRSKNEFEKAPKGVNLEKTPGGVMKTKEPWEMTKGEWEESGPIGAKYVGGKVYYSYKSEADARQDLRNYSYIKEHEGQNIFYRATNNKNEHNLGDIFSKDHRDNVYEKGMSVSEQPYYKDVFGYKYIGVVKGEIIGYGSDGEPLLKNVKWLQNPVDDISKLRKDFKYENIKKKAPFDVEDVEKAEYINAEHEDLIRDALKRGENVPNEVLADYPDLKKYKNTSSSSEAEMGGVQAAPGGFNIPTSSAPVSGEPISTGEVVRRIGRAFNVPIRLGRFNRPFAGGIYKQLEKVARIKGYGNIAVAAHEVAHHMDHTSNVLQNIPSAVMLDELRNLDYSPRQRRKSEGFAEFMRHYLTDGEAQLHAPDFYQYFENVWLPNSQWAAAVSEAKAAVDQWRNQGFSNRIGAQISFNVSRWGRLKKYLGQPKTIIHAIGDAMFNRLGPMVRVSREMTGQRDVLTAMPADVNFWAFAKVANMAASAKARNAAKYGMIDVAGNLVGPGLIEIMAPVAEQMKDQNTLLDFYKYLYARHAIDVITQGKDPGITLQDAQDGVAMWVGRPGWQQAADGITNWHSQLIDYLVDAGGLTQEAADLMREMYPNYISLARDMEIETPMPRGTGGAKMANLPNPIKRLKGSKRPIIPPMETALTYAERLIGLADKIRVGKMMVNAAKQYGMLGRVVEKVDPDLVPHSMSLDNLKSQLTALGADLNNADMDGMLTMFEQSFFGDPKDRVLTFFENGKRQVYQIGEEYDALYRAFVAMDKPAKLPRIIDLTFGTASRAMRLGATGIRAGFSLVTNPIRDIQTAVMQSEAQTANPASIALRSVGGVIKDLSNNEVARLWKTGGGEMAQPLGIDRRFAQEMIQEVLSQDPKSKVLNWAKHPVDSIRGLFSIPEAGPRIAEFEAELKRLGWQPGRKLTFEQYVKAQLKAANVTVDFREGGSFSMWINQIVPFFNVGFQGPNRMYDKMTRKPVQTTAAGIMWITLPTLALWFMYKDDDWFKNLPPYERWRYWHLKLNGTIIRIPKPFEWGHLFGSIPEAAVDAAYRKDPQAIDDAMGITGKDLLPSIIPAAVEPAAEVAFDYDIYRGRRLIPQSLQKYNPEDQAAQYTTETAKKIGKLFNVPPIYVDHLVEGYTGGLGTDIISGAEYAARGVGALPEKGVRPKELSDIPVVGRLFLRPNATRVFDDFYSRLEKLKQETSSTKLRGEPVNPDKAAKLKKMNKVALKLAAKRKEIRNIVSDTKMSEDDKRIKIVAINKEMEEMAGTQVKELKALKEKLARMGIKTRF